MRAPEHIRERIYCDACEHHFDLRVRGGTVALDGKLVDGDGNTSERVLCPKCHKSYPCNSVDPYQRDLRVPNVTRIARSNICRHA